MYSLDDFKVTLKNPEEVKHFVRWHGETACICYNTNPKFAERVGESVIADRHFSGSRGYYFIFEIECPRFTADQIMRHDIGTFKNCQSQRYVDMDDNFSIYVPPQVMADENLQAVYREFERQCKSMYEIARIEMNWRHIKGEKANDLMRTMLPIGVKTKLVMGFTIEALENFMNKRLCTRADLPIRKVACLMKEEVIKVEPRYEHLLVPQCKKLMYCPEKHSCGSYPTKSELKETITLGYEKRFEIKEEMLDEI